MYNTARGTCYTFIADVTGATEEQVIAFFHESLMPVGLVHDHVFSDEEWQQYRKDNPPCIGAKGNEPVGDYWETLPKTPVFRKKIRC